MPKNTLCWVDIPVTNLDRAMKFYSAVLGREVAKHSDHGMEFGLLPHFEDYSPHRPAFAGEMIALVYK